MLTLWFLLMLFFVAGGLLGWAVAGKDDSGDNDVQKNLLRFALNDRVAVLWWEDKQNFDSMQYLKQTFTEVGYSVYPVSGIKLPDAIVSLPVADIKSSDVSFLHKDLTIPDLSSEGEGPC